MKLIHKWRDEQSLWRNKKEGQERACCKWVAFFPPCSCVYVCLYSASCVIYKAEWRSARVFPSTAEPMGNNPLLFWPQRASIMHMACNCSKTLSERLENKWTKSFHLSWAERETKIELEGHLGVCFGSGRDVLMRDSPGRAGCSAAPEKLLPEPESGARNWSCALHASGAPPRERRRRTRPARTLSELRAPGCIRCTRNRTPRSASPSYIGQLYIRIVSYCLRSAWEKNIGHAHFFL